MSLETLNAIETTTQVAVENKPKKRGRKPGKNRKGYFYEEEEAAFVKYITSTDQAERNKLFNEKLLPAFTKMIESIKVKDVRDSQGKSVFSSASSTKVPAELIFAVPDDMFKLLTRADKIQSNNIQIFPVPRNKEYTEQQGTTLVASQQIQDLINSKSDLTFN